MGRAAIALLLIGPIVAVIWTAVSREKAFDRSAWSRASAYGCRSDNPRPEMVPSAIERIRGLNRQEVIDLLGQPSDRHSLPGRSSGWITGEHMGCEILLVVFSDTGMVDHAFTMYS